MSRPLIRLFAVIPGVLALAFTGACDRHTFTGEGGTKVLHVPHHGDHGEHDEHSESHDDHEGEKDAHEGEKAHKDGDHEGKAAHEDASTKGAEHAGGEDEKDEGKSRSVFSPDAE